MAPDDPRHGRNAGYIAGCREECCRVPHADYKRSLHARRYLNRTDKLQIDGTGTKRRIHALCALGWTYRDINEAAGKPSPHVGGLAHSVMRYTNVHISTAAAIARAYDQLSTRPADGPNANRQRRMAQAKGWLPPIWWDDDTIDDPDCDPRTSARRTYPAAELVAEWDFLRRTGCSMAQAAERLGVTPKAIEKALARVRETSAA